MLTALTCYERCVQAPGYVAAFLRAVHGGEARVLREDFCGTAAVSRRWIEEGLARGEDVRAVGVDLDRAALEVARGAGERLALYEGDVLGEGAPGEKADVVFVGNFSIGYIHERAGLVAYLRASRARLERGGVFVCDTYGGESAMRLGGLTRRHAGPGGSVIHYHWEHERADPLTNMVENSISFRVELEGEIVQEMKRAFVYRWRLWSIAELREAMREAGFEHSHVYKDVNVSEGTVRAVGDGAELGADWVVMVAAR